MSQPDPTDEPFNPIQIALAESIAAHSGLPSAQILTLLRPPPKPEMGDYALPCFPLAKAKQEAPDRYAATLAEALKNDRQLTEILEQVETAGPFLNLRIKPGEFCARTLTRMLKEGEKFGGRSSGSGKRIVIDYSAPNIAKPFHVGHLMSTIIGASLVRIFRCLGYEVIGVNHLGDWGTQTGYQLLAWQRANPAEREGLLQERGLDYLADLYVGINEPGKTLKVLKEKFAKASPEERAELQRKIDILLPQVEEIDREARAQFKRLEDGDPELYALWKRMREKTLEVLQKSYDRLGVSFESDYGEAFYEPMLKPLVEELKNKGVLELSEGAWVIKLSKPGDKRQRPPLIVVKSDGATKYETRDLAAAIFRKQQYDFTKNLYVVDNRQSGHFEGLFLGLEKAGYTWAKDCHHVAFGTMSIREDGVARMMTTRGGRMVPLTQLLDTMVAIVRSIVEEKNPELDEAKKISVAEAVGVGAIVFWVQSRRRLSDIVFDQAQATSPDGDTGPYVQYTHARACSILRKCGWVPDARQAKLNLLQTPEEVALVKRLDGFPEAIQVAADNFEPSMISSWLLETSRCFNDFYNKHSVIRSEDQLRTARLMLVDATRLLLVKGLKLIGLAAPEEM